MPDATCKTCKHWGNLPNDDLAQVYCLNPKLRDGVATGKQDGACGVLREYGGGGWNAMYIHCGPDFGCIHWEKRDGA